MFLFEIFLTLCFVTFSFGENGTFLRSENPRIINGEILDIESVPYYVSVFKPGTIYRHWCGASIISTTYLLSAAHCFEDDLFPGSYSVRSGTTRVSRGGKVTNITKIIIHPFYNPDIFDRDFALLNLKGALAFNERTQAIKLVEYSDNVPADTEVFASGHGTTNEVLESTEFLRGVLLTVIDNGICDKAYGSGRISGDMLCTSSEDSKQPCRGDSGGPLERLSDGVLVGVVSFGTENCDAPEVPEVYSRVSGVRPWIKEVAKV